MLTYLHILNHFYKCIVLSMILQRIEQIRKAVRMNLNKFFLTYFSFEEQFENLTIMDIQFFSFESIGRIFSVKDLLAI